MAPTTAPSTRSTTRCSATAASGTRAGRQLFHTDVDRAEVHDLAAEEPEKLEDLKALWFEAAKAHLGLALNDLRWSSTCR